MVLIKVLHSLPSAIQIQLTNYYISCTHHINFITFLTDTVPIWFHFLIFLSYCNNHLCFPLLPVFVCLFVLYFKLSQIFRFCLRVSWFLCMRRLLNWDWNVDWFKPQTEMSHSSVCAMLLYLRCFCLMWHLMRSFGGLSMIKRVLVLVCHQNQVRNVFKFQILPFLISPVISFATSLQESLFSAKPTSFCCRRKTLTNSYTKVCLS